MGPTGAAALELWVRGEERRLFRRRPCGLPYQDSAGHDFEARVARFSTHTLNERHGGNRGHCAERLANRRQGRIDLLCQCYVITACNREFIRYLDALPCRDPEHASG